MAQLMTLTEKLIVITACPQGTLSLQWKKEIEDSPLEFEASAVIDGTNRKWKDDLEEMILRVTIGYYNHVIIFTTHATGAKEEFVDMIHKSSDGHGFIIVKVLSGVTSLDKRTNRSYLFLLPKLWL